jgi:hypothetical protein
MHLTVTWFACATPQRNVNEEVLDELRALVGNPTQLGQLPVFMAQLGAAVKQDRTLYPVYALFRPVRLPKSVYDYVWGSGWMSSVNELRQYLVSGCTAAGVGGAADNRVVLLVWHLWCVRRFTHGVHALVCCKHTATPLAVCGVCTSCQQTCCPPC